MTIVVRETRAPDVEDRTIDASMAGLIKGMLVRGDRQSDIAAFFLINSGRISEINTGRKFAGVVAARQEDLPPPGPYPSPYELWRNKQNLWRVRAALENVEHLAREALVGIHKLEQR